jgi:hypothetical protein
MAQLRAELSEKKSAIAEARWRAEASYTARITEALDPKSRAIAIAERERELARCESHEQAAVAEYHKAVAILMAEAAKGDIREDTKEVANDDNDTTAIHFGGSQAFAIRTAVAVFEDSPAIPAGCSFSVSVYNHDHKALGLADETVVHLSAYNSNKTSGSTLLTVDISEEDSEEEKNEKFTKWRKAVDFHFAQGKEEDNE